MTKLQILAIKLKAKSITEYKNFYRIFLTSENYIDISKKRL